MERLRVYLISAKENGWCLDIYGLMMQYSVTEDYLRKLIKEIYNHNYKN